MTKDKGNAEQGVKEGIYKNEHMISYRNENCKCNSISSLFCYNKWVHAFVCSHIYVYMNINLFIIPSLYSF